MTREQQTQRILGGIAAAVLAFFAYDHITNPNLDGLSGWERCGYWAYSHNHGGSTDQCQQAEAMAASHRMAGDSDPAFNIVGEEAYMNSTDASNEAPVEPTQLLAEADAAANKADAKSMADLDAHLNAH